MKRLLLSVIVIVFLCGCTSETKIDDALKLRNQLLDRGYSFDVAICADYSDKIYNFVMNCVADTNGSITFSVLEPETISGITGTISDEGGKITFDDKVLLFETIADGTISPVSAPWLLVKALRSGYIKACGSYDDGLYMQIDDSYKENAVQTEIWTNTINIPAQAEILWQGRRILTLTVENFTFL